MCRGRMAYIKRAQEKSYPAQYNTISTVCGTISKIYTSNEKGKTVVRFSLQGYKDTFIYITTNEEEVKLFNVQKEITFDAYVTENLSIVTDIS
ncbi:MAG: hypothetical protein J6A15_09880 [Clostridia bacterium]|nr:hypothetical protein [Clostridia bacterium]